MDTDDRYIDGLEQEIKRLELEVKRWKTIAENCRKQQVKELNNQD